MQGMNTAKTAHRKSAKKLLPASASKQKGDPTQSRMALSRYGRDRVSNGSKLIANLDYRSREFRRWKFLYDEARGRVGPAGDQLARQYATAVLRREQLDADVCNNKHVDPVALTRLCSLIIRLERALEALTEAHNHNDAHARRQRALEDAEAGLL